MPVHLTGYTSCVELLIYIIITSIHTYIIPLIYFVFLLIVEGNIMLIHFLIKKYFLASCQ
jgi:hypothetical protein